MWITEVLSEPSNDLMCQCHINNMFYCLTTSPCSFKGYCGKGYETLINF